MTPSEQPKVMSLRARSMSPAAMANRATTANQITFVMTLRDIITLSDAHEQVRRLAKEAGRDGGS